VFRAICLACALLWSSCEASPPTFTAAAPPLPAPYSIGIFRLDAALDCRGGEPAGGGRGEPVLLVHGTAVTRRQNWAWSYWPALASAGFEVCWVALPNAGLGDIQVAAEYVARAVEVMAARSGEQVDVIGHSQGGLVARWAIKYFSARELVDDLVQFAAPNHGTLAAQQAIAAHKCFAACWQMRENSRFLVALNEGDESPGPASYTSIYTANDEFVRPVESSALEGAGNILIQDLCPGRPVEHLLMAGDAVTWELTLDALTHAGPADPGRISSLSCFKLALPGATLDYPRRGADTSVTEFVGHEPPLRDYVRRN
jgi:triacylglycerol lipase